MASAKKLILSPYTTLSELRANVQDYLPSKPFLSSDPDPKSTRELILQYFTSTIPFDLEYKSKSLTHENTSMLFCLPETLSKENARILLNQPNLRSPAQPIKWKMFEILKHRCWRCRYWKENEFHEHGWYCRLKYQIQYDAWENKDHFPREISWTVIPQSAIHEDSEAKVSYFDAYNSGHLAFYKIDECPVYRETQEYHEWKESNVIPIEHSKMVL